MTDKKDREQDERDELDLDAERVKDLEPNEQAAEQIHGGRSSSGGSIGGSVASSAGT